MRKLDAEQRLVFAELTFRREKITTSELTHLLHLSDRTLRDRVKLWIEHGFLVPVLENPKRIRSVMLSEEYRHFACIVEKEVDKYQYLLW